ncbi:MAG TPA: transporter substrate-binding domain-containing protein [Kofleriaceae bacterium]|nr:transporter substrate-binding domain-containing protein [Kofleriaceae bacterium]
MGSATAPGAAAGSATAPGAAAGSATAPAASAGSATAPGAGSGSAAASDDDDDDRSQPPLPPGTKLIVYTKPIEPFAFQKDGHSAGFSLELWDRVARELGVDYELRWVKTVGDLIEVIRRGQGDVGIAAISITSEREKLIDFSTPYYESGLAILTRAQGQGVFALMKETFWTRTMAKFALVLLLILVACAHLVWFFERRINADQFPPTYWRGVWEASWWAISTILSGGCDAKGPMHVIGRLFGAIWMLTCIVVITYFTAAITTVMTVSHLTSDINGPSDLPGKAVATVTGSTAEKYLREHGAKVSSYDTIDRAFTAMDDKEVVAVVYDQPILAYHVKVAGRAGQQVVGLFERQNYGIGLREGSPLRKRINTILLQLAESGVIDDLRTKWFGYEQ